MPLVRWGGEKARAKLKSGFWGKDVLDETGPHGTSWDILARAMTLMVPNGRPGRAQYVQGPPLPPANMVLASDMRRLLAGKCVNSVIPGAVAHIEKSGGEMSAHTNRWC